MTRLFDLDPQRRDAILNTALKEFSSQGYDNASTNVIAKEAGISKALMFHYVNNKKTLFLVIIQLVQFFNMLKCTKLHEWVIINNSKGSESMENIQDIIVDFTRKVQDILGVNLSQIILYGSYARGKQRENPDVGFMILTTLTEDEIEKTEPILYDLAFEFELKCCIDISVIVKNEEHYYYWLGALPFYNNIEREGVVLNG